MFYKFITKNNHLYNCFITKILLIMTEKILKITENQTNYNQLKKEI